MNTHTQFPDVAPWPGQAGAGANPRAVTGHNKPPLEELVPAEFRAVLLADKPEFLTRLRDLVEAADRAKATNDDELVRCGDLVNAYRAAGKHIDATHVSVKAPYLLGGRLVDAEKNTLTAMLSDAKGRVERVGNEYVAKREAAAKAERDRLANEARIAAEAAARAERERVAAERAANDAIANAANAAERDKAIEQAFAAADRAEAAASEAALACAPIAKAEPVRSDTGATVSGSQVWESKVEDFSKAFRHVKGDPKVQEAIEAAIKRLVRAGKRELTGVNIYPVSKANYR